MALTDNPNTHAAVPARSVLCKALTVVIDRLSSRGDIHSPAPATGRLQSQSVHP